MKKILIAFMALFAISMNTYAQYIEHKFSGNHSKEEWNGVVSDRLNPFILERVNGGDWYKLSNDRVVIEVDHWNRVIAHNYTKWRVRFAVTSSRIWYDANGKECTGWNGDKESHDVELGPNEGRVLRAYQSRHSADLKRVKFSDFRLLKVYKK